MKINQTPAATAAAHNTANHAPPATWEPAFSRWRHGGWYVHNVRYPCGAIGCVSRNYPDRKWRIVCDSRRSELGTEGDITFPNRDAAARAEYALAMQEHAQKGEGSV
jgi:hypothetical protein